MGTISQWTTEDPTSGRYRIPGPWFSRYNIFFLCLPLAATLLFSLSKYREWPKRKNSEEEALDSVCFFLLKPEATTLLFSDFTPIPDRYPSPLPTPIPDDELQSLPLLPTIGAHHL
jgi:hypothetical protein